MTLTARLHSSCPLAGHTARSGGARRYPRALPALLFALSLLIQAALPRTAASDTPKAGEYQIKAAFILNFAGFVDWPDPPRSNNLFTIAILGHDPFESAIDSLNGKTVKGRKVVIKRYDDPEEARDADILFISASEKRALPRIMKTLRNRPVLTVGDSQGFARSGVMISMVMQRKRVGFEINNQAAQQAGIRISSQLLKLAREVIEP
ncbi:MAG TPA: YfiR family protein [Geobacteraceae bacterium]|nr:YfiR family protein [Geobacteraceae bacterium]